MTFQNIEAERARLGWSKADLAKALNVSYGTMKSYMRGATDIPCSKLLKMASLFGCTTDYLLGLSNKKDAS